jgi:putative nucleotidyltransferase with HDIG domain
VLTLPGSEPGPFNPVQIAWRAVRTSLIGIVFTVAVAGVMAFPILSGGQLTMEVGEVASRDVRSPRRVTFTSDILTEEARKKAEASIAPIYTPPDSHIARQQIAYARAVADFIRAVRADPYTTSTQKQVALTALEGVPFSSARIERIVGLRDDAWAKVENETLTVLDLSLRGEIRETNISQVRSRIPTMVGVDLTDEQASIVSTLAQSCVAANSFLDENATVAARTKARQAVEPVTRSYEAGQVIVREGETITALDLEALDHLGLHQPKTDWSDFAGTALLAAVVTLLLGLYLWRFEPSIWNRTRQISLLAALIWLAVVAAKIMVPGRTVLPYLFPAAALPMLLAVLAGQNLAVLVAALQGGLIGVLSGGTFELAVFATGSGMIAAMTMGRVERLSALFRAGLYVAIVNVALILGFQLRSSTFDPIGMLTLLAAGIVNGGLTASLSIGGLFLIGNLFDVTTTLQLMELSRPTHPLLQLLLMKTPGTYHHTLMVANLAEQAAGRIGADPLLVRVGAFYHDVGKTAQPYMFVENQMEGRNIHDKLDPRTSAEIIVRHVTDGLELARRYRLPSRIRAFIPEHHGTMRAGFLYQKAIQQANGDESQVDDRPFRYPGPKPQSKETALLMLADGCEAAVRAKGPSSVEELSEIVGKVIADRVACNQLSDCPLTLHDLDMIRESFTLTLQGVFHPRIQYPESNEATALIASRAGP